MQIIFYYKTALQMIFYYKNSLQMIFTIEMHCKWFLL